MTNEDLKLLLETLNHYRVTSFESEGIKLTLIPSGPKVEPSAKPDPDEMLFWSTNQ